MAKPIILVHAAFMGSWAWERVIVELDARRCSAIAVDLPSRESGGTFADDVAAVKAAIASVDSAPVLVGHSYSGAVITEASAGAHDVDHLVYVGAALPQEGESVFDLVGRDPYPGDLSAAINPGEGGMATLHRDGAQAAMYNDASDEQAQPDLDRLGSHSMSTFMTPVSAVGWKDVESTFIVTLLDRCFSPTLQYEFASHCKNVVEIEAGSVPTLSKPVEVAAAIAAAAQG